AWNGNGNKPGGSSIGDDEHPAIRKERLSLIVGSICLLEAFETSLLKLPPLCVVRQALQIRTHRGAAHPVEHGAWPIHDLKVFGLPDIQADREFAQSVVVEVNRLHGIIF